MRSMVKGAAACAGSWGHPAEGQIAPAVWLASPLRGEAGKLGEAKPSLAAG